MVSTRSLFAVLLSAFSLTSTGLGQEQSNRSSRRQRILSILESHQEPSAPTFIAARYNFGSNHGQGPSGVASDRAISHYRSVSSGWNGRGPDPATPTAPPTIEPPESPYDLWYYKDDSDYTQGPFSSATMLEWQKAGYFRLGLLLRREVDNIFSNLATYTALYGRSPFSKGHYPRAIIVRTTPATTTTTTVSSTSTTTTTTTSTTTASLVNHFYWDDVDDNHILPLRGDGIVPDDDYGRTNDFTDENDYDDEQVAAPNCDNSDCEADPTDGDVRLTGGHDPTEGNIEVFHDGEWGGVCDDEWDEYDAKVACKQLGFPGAISITNGGRFGYTPSSIWMDNMYCYGTEKRLEDCRFEGWGVHDCDRTEAAGVRCRPHMPSTTTTTTTTPKPKIPILHQAHTMEVRLAGGRTRMEGRVEMRFDGGQWGVSCGDGWGVREAIVACRHLGLRYAAAAMETDIFGGGNMTKVISGISCLGHEESLLDCHHDMFGDVFCPGEGQHDLAAVVCTDVQADLEPDLYQLVTSAYLEDKPLYLLQCAMEENCVAAGAYIERQTNPYWQQVTRRLLRFTTAISNIGTADFRPFIPKDAWQWHACHQHYHSMEVFSHFEILDLQGNRVVEGHKASFCLEDNDCHGVEEKYKCENFGDQGITAGCKDIYYYNIDCQWIDITDLNPGTYIFKMAINPEYKIPEMTFENNAALCNLHYNEVYAHIHNCSHVRP